MKWLFRKIKAIFVRPVVANDYGSGPVESLKWGYIVPHTKVASGATGERDGQKFSEYGYGLEVAKINRAVFPFATRDEGGVRGAVKKLKAVKCTASIEAHLNSYNGVASGAEILVRAGDSASIEVAENILQAFAVRFPSAKIRGIKEKKRGERGRRNLDDAGKEMKVVLLSEFFFIDSEYISPQAMAEFLRGALV